jgi:hypothetical protein
MSQNSNTVPDAQQPRQSPKDHLQNNTRVLHVPYDNNVSTTVPLHPTCNPVKWEVTHVNIQELITSHPSRQEPGHSDQYTSEIYIYSNLNSALI